MSHDLTVVDDCPDYIQKIKYNSGFMWFEVFLCNGFWATFTTDQVCRSIGLLQLKPTKMQWLQAENNIRKLIESDMSAYFDGTIAE